MTCLYSATTKYNTAAIVITIPANIIAITSTSSSNSDISVPH